MVVLVWGESDGSCVGVEASFWGLVSYEIGLPCQEQPLVTPGIVGAGQ